MEVVNIFESFHFKDTQSFDQTKETEMAMEVFDDVLNSLNTNVSGGSGSGAGSGKPKKKRKDRDSFKNGGTWPRARGGPVIEQVTICYQIKITALVTQLIPDATKQPPNHISL